MNKWWWWGRGGHINLHIVSVLGKVVELVRGGLHIVHREKLVVLGRGVMLVRMVRQGSLLQALLMGR